MVDIRWNIAGFKATRNSPEMQRLLERKVAAIADRLPDGYESGVEQGKTRLRGHVVTATGEAIEAESRDKNLLRALASQVE